MGIGIGISWVSVSVSHWYQYRYLIGVVIGISSVLFISDPCIDIRARERYLIFLVAVWASHGFRYRYLIGIGIVGIYACVLCGQCYLGDSDSMLMLPFILDSSPAEEPRKTWRTHICAHEALSLQHDIYATRQHT